MATYRRAHVPGGCYFFTVVTYARQPLLADRLNIEALGRAFRTVREERPFVMDAFVLLPDHLHCLWRLPEGDADYSSRWRDIKKYASQEFFFPPGTHNAGSAASGNTSFATKTTGNAIWITSITTPSNTAGLEHPRLGMVKLSTMRTKRLVHPRLGHPTSPQRRRHGLGMMAKTPAPLRDASAGALRLPRATKSRMHIEVRIPPESSDCRSAW
ncbi:REP-associated tyrosine transposase [Halomonas sp. PA16-9]|uniref:REP-associated tyrosine transposase n=1 Tax=Halomonas sp. PA16-9 TaxID=2576841 RepID=UPI0030EF2C0D